MGVGGGGGGGGGRTCLLCPCTGHFYLLLLVLSWLEQNNLVGELELHNNGSSKFGQVLGGDRPLATSLSTALVYTYMGKIGLQFEDPRGSKQGGTQPRPYFGGYQYG